MANSKSICPIDIIDHFHRNLYAQVRTGDHLAVALSGGVDSVVLLDLLSKFSKPMQLELSAIHIEHGISPHANQWSTFCQTLCDRLTIPLSIFRLKIHKQPQESLEAIARQARYQVFERIQTDYIVLAHHQDDQAETLLLQLLRGAGVRGLSSMPITRPLKPGTSIKLLRPLLDIPRSAILFYAKQHGLSWVTDESNTDTSFNRNFLRHRILPLLEQRYPAYRKTLFRSSQHLSEATYLLDELAKIDAKNIIVTDKIKLEELRNLDFPRAKNLLRYLLTQQIISLPNTTKLEETLRQLYSIRTDTRFRFVLDTLEIRCYRGLIEFLPIHSEPQPISPIPWQGEQYLVIEPLQSTLEFTYQVNMGIDLEKLIRHTITIRSRSGGERFQPDCRRPRRSLKKILQEAALPPWKRNALPLLFCEDQLVWVAGIGIDCNFQVQPGNIGLVITWHANQTLSNL
jgi:tRNA(Ile)-lysidine synthase